MVEGQECLGLLCAKQNYNDFIRFPQTTFTRLQIMRKSKFVGSNVSAGRDLKVETKARSDYLPTSTSLPILCKNAIGFCLATAKIEYFPLLRYHPSSQIHHKSQQNQSLIFKRLCRNLTDNLMADSKWEKQCVLQMHFLLILW